MIASCSIFASIGRRDHSWCMPDISATSVPYYRRIIHQWVISWDENNGYPSDIVKRINQDVGTWMRTLVCGDQTTLGEHLEFSIFRYFSHRDRVVFPANFSTPDVLTIICRYLDSVTAMQRALNSRTRASILPSISSYSSPLSRARRGGAIAVGLQQQRFAHKVR